MQFFSVFSDSPQKPSRPVIWRIIPRLVVSNYGSLSSDSPNWSCSHSEMTDLHGSEPWPSNKWPLEILWLQVAVFVASHRVACRWHGHPAMTFHFDSPEESGNGRDLGVHGNQARNTTVTWERFRKNTPPKFLTDYWLVVEPTHLKNMLVKLDIFPK